MGLILQGSYVSSANAQIRIAKPGGGAEMFTAMQTMKLDEEVNAALVEAIGSYGPIGSTDGVVKATGEFGMPIQEMVYLDEILAATHPTGSIALVKFTITVTISNGVDPTITIKAFKCRKLKRTNELTKGTADPTIDTSPLLIEGGIERNKRRLLKPSTAFVGLR